MATTFSSGVGKIAGAADIEALKGPQLVALYNELTGGSIKKFADRKAAIKRTVEAFASWASKQSAGSKGRKAQEGGGEATGGRTYRPESKRGQVIELASTDDGATYKQLKKATGWEDAELGAALARIKSYNGLTVSVDGEGDDRVVKITGALRTRKAFSFEPKAEIKPHKPDTKRARVLDLLLSKTGATFTQIQEETGWDDRTTYEGIRLIHGYLGYGLREDDDGSIHAYVGNAKMMEKPVKEPKPPKEKKGNKAA